MPASVRLVTKFGVMKYFEKHKSLVLECKDYIKSKAKKNAEIYEPVLITSEGAIDAIVLENNRVNVAFGTNWVSLEEMVDYAIIQLAIELEVREWNHNN